MRTLESMKEGAREYLACSVDVIKSADAMPEPYTANYSRCIASGALFMAASLGLLTPDEIKQWEAKIEKGAKE